MRFWLGLLVAVMLAGCAEVRTYDQASRPPGEAVAGVGEVVLRVQVTDSLPNAWGRADLYGRTRDRGFAELRYLGLNATGQPVFRRREVEVMTNETVMSRMGMRTGFATVSGSGSSATVTSFGSQAPASSMAALPAGELDIVLDLRESRTLMLRERRIEVLAVSASSVRFRVE